MQNKLEKFGSIGAIVAAAACPVCFPKLALLGALFGFGALAPYETIFFIAVQILVVLAIAGHFLSYKTHRNRILFTLALISVIVFFIALYALPSEILAYGAFSGLIAATIWLVFENRRCMDCITTSE